MRFPRFLLIFNIALSVGRIIRDSTFIYNKLHFTQHPEFSSNIDMTETISNMKGIELQPHRRNDEEAPRTQEELTGLRRLAGRLNNLGHGVLPPACYTAS